MSGSHFNVQSRRRSEERKASASYTRGGCRVRFHRGSTAVRFHTSTSRLSKTNDAIVVLTTLCIEPSLRGSRPMLDAFPPASCGLSKEPHSSGVCGPQPGCQEAWPKVVSVDRLGDHPRDCCSVKLRYLLHSRSPMNHFSGLVYRGSLSYRDSVRSEAIEALYLIFRDRQGPRLKRTAISLCEMWCPAGQLRRWSVSSATAICFSSLWMPGVEPRVRPYYQFVSMIRNGP